jgi:hypothetical protein
MSREMSGDLVGALQDSKKAARLDRVQVQISKTGEIATGQETFRWRSKSMKFHP